MGSTRLTAESRQQALAALAATTDAAHELDVLVIGGGVTGAGIALDAATRGLSTAIVEAQDWSAGTSSRSSKLVHGGLRYLQMLDFALVREALTERDLLIKELAPHLVKPVPFLYPLTKPFLERAFVGAGIGLYDALASLVPGKRAMPFHQHFGRRALLKKFPDLAPGRSDRCDPVLGRLGGRRPPGGHAGPHGGLVRGARREPHAGGRADPHGYGLGQRRRRRRPGDREADHGPGAARHQRHRHLDGPRRPLAGRGGLKVLASKGVHIVVPRERLTGTSGLILQTEKSVLFVIPWSRYWIIGTTDTPYTEDLWHPVPSAADIDYVLEKANAVLGEPLTREDIIGSFAGLRPLLQPGTKEGTSSAKVSREHTVANPTAGLSVIAGGKLTTYRVMAKDAVDHAIGQRASALPSITHRIPLEGAIGLHAVARQARAWATRYGWTAATVEHLLHRYGSNLAQLAELCEADPSLALPLEHAPAYLRAEVHYAASHEGALHLEDVVEHRTRLIYEVPDAGLAALPEIAEIVAPLLGWDAAAVETEIASYTDRAHAFQDAITQPDDATAQFARLKAQDIVPTRVLSA